MSTAEQMGEAMTRLLHPTVRDVMTKDVVAVEPTTPFKTIVAMLLRWDIDGVPVLDVGERLVGVVTEADLLSRESYGPQQARTIAALIPPAYRLDGPWLTKAEGLTAGELMSTEVATCTPDEDLRVAARRMLREGRKQLPVMDGDRLVGIVARRDVLSVFDRADAEIAIDVERAIHNRDLLPEAADVEARIEDGVVHLSGSVGFSADIAVILAVLGSIAGVVDVLGTPEAAH
jgi:CBS domain-containing protein